MPAADRQRKRFSVVVLRTGHRPALTFDLPSWSFGLSKLLCACAISLAWWTGFELQTRYGLSGPAAQFAGSDQHAPQRFSAFERLAVSLKGKNTAALRRRGAILYALRLGLGNRRSASQLLSGLVAPEWRIAAERGPAADGTFLWPVADGWYVRGYGSGEGGYHLAVDIMGERGSNVLASAPGIVGYSGRGVRGFGNLVMLVHPGGFVTLYAHNERNYVVPGERVQPGQVIAALGNTGISRGPHVHFELMHGGRNCDPVPLFRPGVRHRAGHLSQIEPLRWPTGERRPKAIRCAPRKAHPRSRWKRGDDHPPPPEGSAEAGDRGGEGGGDERPGSPHGANDTQARQALAERPR